MKYYTIGPTKHLDLVQGYPHHLVVAQHLKNPSVMRFYRNLKRYNKDVKIILDNGAFETGKSMDVKEYIRVAEKLKPNIVVVPDIWKKAEQTLEAVKAFMKRVKEDRYKLMFVPQGNAFDEFVYCFRQMYNVYDARFFGLPYKQWDETTGILRHMLCKYLSESPGVTFHLLGLYNLNEIKMARGLPNVVSCDSSIPFKAAMVGEFLGTKENQGRAYDNRFKFNFNFVGNNLRKAKENMTWMESLF